MNKAKGISEESNKREILFTSERVSQIVRDRVNRLHERNSRLETALQIALAEVTELRSLLQEKEETKGED